MIVVAASGVFDGDVPPICGVEGIQAVVLFADDLRRDGALDCVQALISVRSIGDTPCEFARRVRGVLQKRQ